MDEKEYNIMQMKDRIMVALDVADRRQALALRDALIDRVGWLKIGLRLFVAEGPTLIEELRRHHRIFLDLKFHDIPNTVKQAVGSAGAWGVDMLNVHASGGPAMLQAAAEAATSFPRMRLIAVTVLTSVQQKANTAHEALQAARLARDCGLHGVVCSVREIASIKQALGQEFLTVSPGIRWGGQDIQDQARVATPEEAMRAGGDYLVIGRPVIAATDPAAAVEEALRMMRSGAKERAAINPAGLDDA